MTVEERIDAADRRRAEGNQLFKDDKIEAAIQQYEMVMSLFDVADGFFLRSTCYNVKAYRYKQNKDDKIEVVIQQYEIVMSVFNVITFFFIRRKCHSHERPTDRCVLFSRRQVCRVQV